jgi:heterodisulfide reductase subunit B
MDQRMWLTLGARNLSLAEKLGLDLLAICSGCYETLWGTMETLEHEPEIRKDIDMVLSKSGRSYRGTAKVKHLVEALGEDFGVEKLSTFIKRPLSGVRVALHPGCHLFRTAPEGDIWQKPQLMEELVALTGVEIVSYGLERLCCGFPMMAADQKFALEERLLPKLQQISISGVDCIVFVCPACLGQFETGQKMLKGYSIPSLHLAELLALAVGIPGSELGLYFHRSPVAELVERLGLNEGE